MATTLGVSTLDLLPWAIQCYAAIFFALIYGFTGIGIAKAPSVAETEKYYGSRIGEHVMDFNKIIDRHDTASLKWDFMARYFGEDTHQLLPMWVSDFDFTCPPAVQEALTHRVGHGILVTANDHKATLIH